MASFTAGTTFVDGVANDVTAAKLGALVTNATPTSGFIQDRTAETITATNDTLLFGDASDSNTLKRITVANFAQTLPTAKVTTGTIDTGTFGTTTSTAATITTGTITNLNSTTGTVATLNSTTATIPTITSITKITSGTGTAAVPAISPTGNTNTGIFFPAADTIAFAEGGAEAMRIDSNSNVGIGSTSPGAKLDVTGNIRLSAVSANIEFNNGGPMVYSNAANTLAIATGGGIATPTERLRIDSGGNCSIGTATALSKLHVHGDLTLSNATTAVTASTSTITPPATVAGYLTISINGTSRKIPYYAT